MQGNAKSAAALLLVLVATLCACSPQKSLARRLAEADRVVVTNPQDKTSITISNEEVQKLVKALEASEKIPSEGLCATPGHPLDFFKGTNHLMTIPTSDLIFWIGQTPYHDKSGALHAVYERLLYGEAAQLKP